MHHAKGQVPPQPVALIQIALFADGNVAVNTQGTLAEYSIRGMCGTAEALLVKVLADRIKEGGGIEVPPPDVANRLLG